MGVVWGAFMAAMPDLKAALGVEDGPFGLLLIWGSVAAIAAMSVAPRVAPLLGRWALPVFVAGMGLSLALMGQVGAPLAFLLALMGMGLTSGALDVYMNARLSAIEAARGEPLMNLSHGLYSLAFAAAAALTGLARAGGWGAPQILGVAAGVCVAMALVSIERDGRIEGMGGGRGAGSGALGLVPWLGGALILAGLMSENAVEAWSALYVERDLGGATGSGSLAPALMGLTMGFGRLMGQGLSRRLPERRLLMGGMAVSVAGLLVVVGATGPLMAYAGFVVMGLGGSVVVPTAMALTGRLADPALRGRAIARATVLGYLGYFLGPPMLGLMAEVAGLRASFALVAGVLALAMLVARALLRRA
ncbi:MFS transporter [Pararhodobacter aggregans]|uniref:MFS transporter n=2 Tax=Pararhodobacter aggregans TaxID=404875 RepID=A0A2T7UPN9_9RHOB|nr:MFS transporter [Pararhodobacter aggregans]